MEYEPQELVVIYQGETIHGETCEICQSPRVVEHDVEGVPFCRRDWDEWPAEEDEATA
jgi:hypothetical protein